MPKIYSIGFGCDEVTDGDPEAARNSEPLFDGVQRHAAAMDFAQELAVLKRERDALQRLVDTRQAELSDLGRTKEEFIATASHDLKAPLTSILGYAQHITRLLSSAVPDLGKVGHAMTVIEDQTRAMAHLLDDLLDASRMQLGAFELRLAPCEFGTCLSTVLASLPADANDRINVTMDSAPMAGLWEQRRVEQLLANLITNALKYSADDTSVYITVEARKAGIEVAVSDQGMGIVSTELPHLFERFYRTPRTHDSGVPGSGLGLYICAGIVAAHSGRLWAESAGEGQGTIFRFTLPAYPSRGDDSRFS